MRGKVRLERGDLLRGGGAAASAANDGGRVVDDKALDGGHRGEDDDCEGCEHGWKPGGALGDGGQAAKASAEDLGQAARGLLYILPAGGVA